MDIETPELKKNAPKVPYQDSTGKLLPGVTTVLAELNKPALLSWAWAGGYDCGIRDGYTVFRPTTFQKWSGLNKEATAGVGTIAHYLIHCWLTGATPRISPEFSPLHVQAAHVPLEAFQKYYQDRHAMWVLGEHKMINEHAGYGGTIDLVVRVNDHLGLWDKGHLELWDIKTSKAIYDENHIQLAAYRSLLCRGGRYKSIKPRVVLVTKEGKLSAPDISKERLASAGKVWWSLLRTYKYLQGFRKLS